MKPKKNRAEGRLDEGDAFVPDVARSCARLADDEAESFAEEFIATATSGEFVAEDARDETVPEEIGGPFVEFMVVSPTGEPILGSEEET